MYKCEEKLFEIKDNELLFQETCEKLKKHPFESPWKHCFPLVEVTVADFTCAVRDLNFREIIEINFGNEYSEINLPTKDISQDNFSQEFEMQLTLLKESLMSVQTTQADEHVNGIELFNKICLSQVSVVCNALHTAFLNETTVVAFLNAILKLEKSLSLSIASALIKYIIYPQVFQVKQSSSRTLLASVLKFSEAYTKPAIDEIIIPCLNQPSLETLQLETLLKMVKHNLPQEYNLIERKIQHENSLLENLTQKIESWSLDSKKNVKFTKLVIGILITYGSELDQQQIAVFNDVIKHNETIMKRAAENVIRQLKT